jgi:hypothetical protein
VYHYPSWVHTNYKLTDAVSTPDKRRLESFAIEYDTVFTTTQQEMTTGIIMSMFVNEGRNKLYIHASLRKKGLIVSAILALHKTYATRNK